MFFGAYTSQMNALITDGFLFIGESIRLRSIKPGMVTACSKSPADTPIFKMLQDMIWGEHLTMHLSFPAPSYR